jgi:anti-sigma factor RsiW
MGDRKNAGRVACRESRHALGVYVVGGIDPTDRSAVDAHLAECADCRDELAGLAGLPALLARVPVGEATRLLLDGQRDDHPSLVALLGQAAQHNRHRWRPRLAAAAATGLIAGAGAVTVSRVLDYPQAPPPATAARQWAHTVRGADPRTHASAVVRYEGRPWGVQLAVQVTGVPAGTRCRLQITNSRRQQVESGSWTVAAGHERAWYPASSSVPLSAARAFVITAGSRTLVTVPIR